MRAYPVDQLYAEMAFIAYHFHWPHAELMSLEHRQRRQWCEEISQINRRLNGAEVGLFDIGVR
ncbi:DUF6760 family protein [Streptomyces sp. NPDC016845]|uniref:DUF6760 family protein n=1 Tax=Streptomyces sp. NPDC016845 TaxID=3364972 RepID=UPI0037A4B3F9